MNKGKGLIYFFLLLLVGFCCNVLPAQENDQLPKIIEEGRKRGSLGARNQAILLLQPFVDTTSNLPNKAEALLVLANAWYEEGYFEKYKEVVMRLKESFEKLYPASKPHEAWWKALMIRYHARQMKNIPVYNLIKSMKPYLFDTTLNWQSVDYPNILLQVANGMRTVKPKDALPTTFDYRRELGEKAMRLHYARIDTPTMHTARMHLTLGNICQDISMHYYSKGSTYDTFNQHDWYLQAQANYSQAIRISQKIAGPINTVAARAYSLKGLQYYYIRHYEKALAAIDSGLSCIFHPADTAFGGLLHAEQANMLLYYKWWCMQQWLKWDYKNHHEAYDELYSSYLPYVEKFDHQVLSMFLDGNGKIVDGYRSFPFRYLADMNRFIFEATESSDMLFRDLDKLAFYRYPGLKLQLMEYNFGHDSLEAYLNDYLRVMRLLKAHLENDLLKRNRKQNTSWNRMDRDKLKRHKQRLLNSPVGRMIQGKFMPSLQEIQARLDSNEAILNYRQTFYARKRVVPVIVILPDSVGVVSIKKNKSWGNWATINSDLWNDREEYEHTLYQLYQDNFAGVDSLLQRKHINRVTVLNDWQYYAMPYEAIISGFDSLGNPEYLINKYIFSHKLAFGIDTLLRLSKSGNKKSFAAFHPNYKQRDLPFSARQTKALAQRYGDDLSPKLNEAELLDTLSGYRMLHLSSHGTAGVENYQWYYRYLSDSTFIFLRHDTLTINQLYGHFIGAEMVVVAACEGGFGYAEHGEGLLDFSQAFQQAGVKSVVTALWKVDDKVTVDILNDFYRFLEEGLPKDVALHKAKLNYLNNVDDPAMANPVYWAGLKLIGNKEPIQLTPKRKPAYYRWMVGVLGFIGLLGFIWFMRRRRKKIG